MYSPIAHHKQLLHEIFIDERLAMTALSSAAFIPTRLVVMLPCGPALAASIITIMYHPWYDFDFRSSSAVHSHTTVAV